MHLQKLRKGGPFGPPLPPFALHHPFPLKPKASTPLSKLYACFEHILWCVCQFCRWVGSGESIQQDLQDDRLHEYAQRLDGGALGLSQNFSYIIANHLA